MMLNSKTRLLCLNESFFPKAALAFIFIAIFIAGACGKRKPPLPPVESVPQRTEISGSQQGNKVILSWTISDSKVSDSSVLSIKQFDIYRLAEPVDAPASLTEEDFAARSTLIASLPVSADILAKKQFAYTDTLEFAGQAVKLRYAIRFVNAAGQKAAFSNFLLLEPTAKVAAAPFLAVPRVVQNAIIVKWQTPASNVDGSKPANVLGYNLYRTEDGGAEIKKLNTTPLNVTEFEDKFFEFEKNYLYFARTVSLGSNGQLIESANSNALEIKPKDTFAPTPPTAITIAATPETISIFFASNPENDIAGYRIFRASDPELPKNEWQNLTPAILTTNTFQDTKIESGKTYFYYITAIDKSGNISLPSEVASETVP